MSEKLKSCPWCGELPEIYKAEKGPYKGLTRMFHKCPVMGHMEIQDWSERADIGAEAWNTRQEPNQWISCEEDTPKYGTTVLVFVSDEDGEGVFYGERYPKTGWEMAGLDHRMTVTHWQPLPPPPTKTVIEELS